MVSRNARWLLVAPLSVALGYVLERWHVPAAWIVGAIVVSGSVALIDGRELPVNSRFSSFARGIVGILAGTPLLGISFASLLGLVPIGVAVAAVTLGVGVLGGLLLARAQSDISRESGILSMLAGGASVMPAIAADVGADVRYVTLAQFLRFFAVSMTLPFVASLLTSPGAAQGFTAEPGPTPWWGVLVVVLIALVGGPLARKAHFPAPSVFGPLIISVTIAAALPGDVTLTPPTFLQVLSFLSIGWICGGSLSVPALKTFSKNVPITVAFSVIIMAACAATAWPLTHVLGITYFEAYLATSPGALETVLALAAEGGAGPEVVAIQLVRLTCVLLLAGWLGGLIRLITRGDHS